MSEKKNIYQSSKKTHSMHSFLNNSFVRGKFSPIKNKFLKDLVKEKYKMFTTCHRFKRKVENKQNLPNLNNLIIQSFQKDFASEKCKINKADNLEKKFELDFLEKEKLKLADEKYITAKDPYLLGQNYGRIKHESLPSLKISLIDGGKNSFDSSNIDELLNDCIPQKDSKIGFNSPIQPSAGSYRPLQSISILKKKKDFYDSLLGKNADSVQNKKELKRNIFNNIGFKNTKTSFNFSPKDSFNYNNGINSDNNTQQYDDIMNYSYLKKCEELQCYTFSSI